MDPTKIKTLEENSAVPTGYGRDMGIPLPSHTYRGTTSLLPRGRYPEAISENGRIDLEIPDEIQNLDEFWQELETELGSKRTESPNQIRTELTEVTNTPIMNILMLVVGSRGDVQPFLALAKALRQDGHRIRIATHTCFRALIEEHDIEFFDLGGDPKELMAFMVKNPALIPGLDSIRNGEIRARRGTMRDIVTKCWHACFETDLGDDKRKNFKSSATATLTSRSPMPFVADSIIANPPAIGHIHCAEKLGVPLHIFFTMPWSPTTKIPHPLANVKSSNQLAGRSNLLSYLLVESVIWQGLGDIINAFRYNTLNLDPIHPSKGPLLLQYMRIPHTYCWSPSLLPQPSEWRSNVAVTGYAFLNGSSAYRPPMELQRFLDIGPPPVYVGFGSIVVEDPSALYSIILQAVRKTGYRLILSTGWSDSDLEVRRLGPLGTEVYLLRADCPHEWLFPRMACIVHHGGAGTTAAALKAGRPIVTLPFFGDQFFWGNVVYESGAGPEPIPYQLLQIATLVEALEQALRPETVVRAGTIGQQIKKEDGIGRAIEHFYSSLPQRDLACHLLPSHVATWRMKRTGVLLSALSATILRKEGLIKWNDLRLHRSIEYDTVQGPYEPISGAIWAVTQLIVDGFRGMGEMIFEIPYFPVACHNLINQSFSRMRSRQAAAGKEEASRKELSYFEESPASRLPLGSERVASEGKDHKVPGEYMFNGMTRVLKAAARAPGSFTSAMAHGSHNLPRLWNDRTVRPPAKVTGFRSGMVCGGKELALGVYDGASGLFVQPILGLIQDGPLGFIKGAAKGVLGLPIKFFAAANGVVGYPLKGLNVMASRALKTDGMKAVQRERMLQGEYEFTMSTSEQRRQVISKWRHLNRN